MGQILHGSATTTHAIRAAIQRSCALNAALSRELGINVKTVAKWRKRQAVEDVRMGPKEAHSTVLSVEEEAVTVLWAASKFHPDLFPEAALKARVHDFYATFYKVDMSDGDLEMILSGEVWEAG